MPFPAEHMLLAWTGAIINTAGRATEDFAGSMRFAGTGGLTGIGAIDNDDAFDDVLADLTTFWTDSNSFIPSAFRITSAKWNRIGTNGRYVSPNTRERVDLDIRGVTGNGYPRYLCLVSSWRTDVRRGLANRGRTYWPTSVPLEAAGDGNVGLAQIDLFANQCATLIENWGNWPGLDQTTARPVVGSNIGAGAFNAITSVDVGDQLDVQQRRKRQPETRRRALVGG